MLQNAVEGFWCSQTDKAPHNLQDISFLVLILPFEPFANDSPVSAGKLTFPPKDNFCSDQKFKDFCDFYRDRPGHVQCKCVCLCVRESERETLPHHPLNTHAHTHALTYTPDTSNGFFQDHMSFASAQQQYSLYNYSQARRERQTCCIIEGGRWKVEGIKLCV